MRKPEASTTEDLLSTINRALPFSDEAEKGVLSCLLQDPVERIPETKASVPSEAFYHEANRTIYEALLHLDGLQPRAEVDPVTLTHYLRKTEKLDKVGGPAAITELFAFVPISAHYPHYLKILRDLWLLRQGIAEHTAALHALFEHGKNDDDADVLTTLQNGEQRVFAVIEGAQKGEGSGPKHIVSAVHECNDHLQKLQANKGKVLGISTGWPDLDRAMGGIGLEAGDVFVIAARPKMGKTNMLVSMLKAIGVDQSIPTAVFSLEMSQRRLNNRLMYGGYNIETSKASTGFLDRRADQENYTRANKELSRAPIYIDDTTDLSTADLRARVRILKRRHGIRVVMLDYVQLVTAVTKIGLSEERHQIAEVMKTMHSLARSEGLIFVALAQAGRGAETNPRHEPTSKDFDGGSAIEKFVDYGSFIHRPSRYKRWEDLKEAEQDYFRRTVEPKRKANPDCWSEDVPVLNGLGEEVFNLDGTQKMEWRVEKDWEEHAILLLTLNRNGDDSRIWLRFNKDFTRFDARNKKLYSNNPANRQIEMEDRFTAPPKSSKSSKAKDEPYDGWSEEFAS